VAHGADVRNDPAVVPLGQARRAFDRDYLVRILTLTRGNVSRAARLAGRNRTEFYRLLERHGLAPAAFKASP
jgi:two-component system response regulator GlrR